MQFLGAVRTIKQDIGSYGVQCIVAVGPFSIVFMRGESGSPFNVREAVPVHFFTPNEVAELFEQYARTKSISLEAGIAANIHELTAGHAGLVCACGRALESGGGLLQDGLVQLAAWQDFRARRIIETVLQWPTIGNMADSVSKMVQSARQLLERALLAGNAPLQLKTALTETSEAARYLAAEGWFVAVGSIGAESYRFTSPLVRSLALHQLAKQRGWEMVDPLPFVGATDELDVPAALRAALPYFRPATMRSVSATSSKTSKAAVSVFRQSGSRIVPNEAVYHFELFSVLRQWLGYWERAELYPEADVLGYVGGAMGSTETPKRYADMLIGPSSTSGLKHVLELVASSSSKEIQAHYSRTINYMNSHDTTWGACITFTAVASASAVVVPSSSLEWPTTLQFGTGLVAIHVVHNLVWTQAKIYWKSGVGTGAFTVDLAAKHTQ